MKKALQKIATFALIVVGFLVTLFLLLVVLGAFDFGAYIDGNRVVHSLVIVLAIIYTVLGVYLVIEIFAGDTGLSTMVLFSDNMNAVSTTSRVVRRLVTKTAKSLDIVKVKKLIITQDDKPGFKLGVHIKVSGGEVSSTTEKLRFLIANACKDVLGVTFNSIHIKVVKLENSYTPDLEGAENFAKAQEQKQICKEACEMVSPAPTETPSLEQAEQTLKQSAEKIEDTIQEVSQEQTAETSNDSDAVEETTDEDKTEETVE